MASNTKNDRTLEEQNESLYKKGATDGLPVIPPTDDRVEEMLRGTDLAPDHVIGRLGNREDKLTVEKLATNAVMAGCLPTYMPVLIAGAKALADEDANAIQFSVSTGSWAYLWLLNGPIREQIGIRSDTGAFGPGFQANRSIGRALGLAYKNTAHIHPGEKDMGVMGSPFKYSLIAGENQERSPWEPYHVTHGYDEDDSTITLAGPNSFNQYTPYQMDAEHVLEAMIYHTPPYMNGAKEDNDLTQTVFNGVSPYNAAELDDAGLSKQEVKEYICENSYMSKNKYARGFVQDKVIEHRQQGKKVPDLQIPQFADTDHLKLPVLGGSGRFNVAIGKSIGGPVTKKVEFPDNWDSLVEEYRTEREWTQAESYYDE